MKLLVKCVLFVCLCGALWAESGFGTLPAGVDRAKFLAWIAPDRNASQVVFTGAKKWGKGDRFVAAACFEPYDGYCANKKGGFYLGVFRLGKKGFEPIARYPSSVFFASNDSAQVESKAPKDPSGDAGLHFYAFDLGDYSLNESEKAFGVRLGYGWGAGDNAGQWEFLQLFRVEGDRVASVFREALSANATIGCLQGEDCATSAGFGFQTDMKFLKTKTNGYYDIELITNGAKRRLCYQKSDDFKDGMYLPCKE